MSAQSSPMGNFVYSFATARLLLKRAHDNGFLIEGMVLYVSLIDGLLRLAIILDKQLAGDPVTVNEYMQQVPGGAKISERAIYEEARRRGIIDEALRAEVVDLYEHRNAIVHRFFLTELQYADLEPHLIRYEQVYDHCSAIVANLEDRQVREGKGMTVTGPEADQQAVPVEVLAKLGFKPDLSPRRPPNDPPRTV
ncbi:hypothetical protein ACIBPB_27170 [Micromonospora sp. NPDC049836]|uniref:hypothetical protein n=1 Tax=Micromonospora sp. NPDC049836 TaxID=3364274 RepID=UPI0037A3BDBA